MQTLANYHMHDIAVEECATGRLTLLITYTDGRLRNDDRLYLVCLLYTSDAADE